MKNQSHKYISQVGQNQKQLILVEYKMQKYATEATKRNIGEEQLTEFDVILQLAIYTFHAITWKHLVHFKQAPIKGDLKPYSLVQPCATRLFDMLTLTLTECEGGGTYQ